ncbi:MAG: phage head closure protein [Phycisphaerae bacterium]
MQIGRLRHRVTLQRPTEARDADYGGLETAWEDAGEVWARVETLKGKALEHARSAWSDVSLRVTLRAGSGVAAGWRIVLAGGRVLEVLAAYDPDEGRGRATECPCREVT